MPNPVPGEGVWSASKYPLLRMATTLDELKTKIQTRVLNNKARLTEAFEVHTHVLCALCLSHVEHGVVPASGCGRQRRTSAERMRACQEARPVLV